MTTTSDETTAFRDELDRRRAKIRQRQLLLALEQWGPADQPDGGNRLLYVSEITGASADETTWLEEHIAANGMPDVTARETAEWHEVRRAQGRQANAAASAAFLAGDYAGAHDLIDDARAYGAIPEKEWLQLHEFIAAKAAAAPAT